VGDFGLTGAIGVDMHHRIFTTWLQNITTLRILTYDEKKKLYFTL
jgi:hypothetical protein